MGLCWSSKKSSPVPPKPESPKPTTIVRKEVFIIKHRNSHEIPTPSSSSATGAPSPILVQCGRLSRSSSTGKASENDTGGENRRIERRRTPSRERDRDSGGSRRLSRSPRRRSESPITNRLNTNPNPNPNSRPAMMISVPATVSSIVSNNNGEGNTVQRIEVRRNVSPARVRVSNETPPMSLSRSNSRKRGNSPHRRNPLVEIDNRIAQQIKEKQPMEEETNSIASSSSSYTARLLEDIQSFHQKNNNNVPPPSFTLPPCLTKACSILEAVADLNSGNGCHFSRTLCEKMDVEEQESSGSNQKQLVYSSSAESTDYWTSASLVSGQNEVSPVGRFKRCAKGESIEKRTDSVKQNEVRRSRIGSRGPPHRMVSVPKSIGSGHLSSI